MGGGNLIKSAIFTHFNNLSNQHPKLIHPPDANSHPLALPLSCTHRVEHDGHYAL